MELNEEFLIETFYSYCKRPLHKKYQNVFNAECSVCKEGKSVGKTRRLFYFPHKQYFYCHNCATSWRPMEWIKETTGWTFPEIVKRNNEKMAMASKFVIPKKQQTAIAISDLPENSIDLTDVTQLSFYSGNKYVNLALDYCKKRRLFTAINSCNQFYLSLEDRVHKNRLVIPFLDNSKKVTCYQTRSLTSSQFPKYLTKFGEKELFGLNNIDSEVPYVFVFEGPIDSMFVKNGLAIASLTPTERQTQQLNNLIGYEQIWVFDNDKHNQQVQNKIEKHIKTGKTIFIWPNEFLKFKDFNEICCSLNLNEIPWKFIVKNSAGGPEALIKQKLRT